MVPFNPPVATRDGFPESRVYGVSFGNGNNGVSRMFADYYVRTSDPFALARLAMIDSFKPIAQRWVNESLDVDGDSEYGVSAMLLDPPCDETDNFEYLELWKCSECGSVADGDCPESCESCGGTEFENDSENAEDGRNYSEHNGAWQICEVFPEDSPREGAPIYDSIIDALGAGVVIAWNMAE